MRPLLLFLVLSFSTGWTLTSAHAQRLTISEGQAQKYIDSAAVLPHVRRASAEWHASYRAEQVTSQQYYGNWQDTKVLLDSKTAQYTTAQSKASKRGVVVALLVIADIIAAAVGIAIALN